LSFSRRLVPPLLACALLLGVSAASAEAATFCVYAPDPCTGTTEPSLQAAIDAAAPDGGGTIRVGFEAPLTAGSHETIRIAAGNAVHIVGDMIDELGLPALVQVGGAAAGQSPVVIDEPGAEITDLGLSDGTTADAPVVELRSGTLSGVRVQASADGATALHLAGGTLRDGTSVDGAGTGVLADGATATIEDTDIFGLHGLDSAAGALTLVRSVVEGDSTALRVTAGAVTSDDSFFSPSDWYGDPDPAARLVDVAPAAGDAVSVTLRSATLDAFDLSGSGLAATCAGGGATADVTLTDALAVRAGTSDLAASGAGCTMHLDHVQFGTRAAAAGGAVYDYGVSLFQRPGDATLLERWDQYAQPSWHSPARNAGSARALAAGETDVLGNPRVVDGARDLGAIEYQHRAPVADIEADQDTVTAGEEADFDDGATRDPDHETLDEQFTLDGMPLPAFSWDDWDGIAEIPAQAQDGDGFAWFTPRAPGAHSIGLTVTDPSGLSSSARQDVQVVAGPVRPPGRAGRTGTTTTPVAPVPAAPQPAAPTAPQIVPYTGRGLQIAFGNTRRLTAGGRLPVALGCMQDSTCTGVVRVLLAGTRTSDRPVAIGRLDYSLRAMQSKTYNITLSKAGRRAIVHSAGKGRRVLLAAYRHAGRGLRQFALVNGTVRVAKRS
jgi:hypothetical protein